VEPWKCSRSSPSNVAALRCTQSTHSSACTVMSCGRGAHVVGDPLHCECRVLVLVNGKGHADCCAQPRPHPSSQRKNSYHWTPATLAPRESQQYRQCLRWSSQCSPVAPPGCRPSHDLHPPPGLSALMPAYEGEVMHTTAHPPRCRRTPPALVSHVLRARCLELHRDVSQNAQGRQIAGCPFGALRGARRPGQWRRCR